MRIGLMAAMPEEIDALLKFANASHQPMQKVTEGMREYYFGKLWGKDVVLVFSKCGKIASAATATHLILKFGVSQIIFTGVAGGADPAIGIGDVVIGHSLIQHDMDASPVFPRHEIPLLEKTVFETDPDCTERLKRAAEDFLSNDFNERIGKHLRDEFALTQPKVHLGMIASGDKFFARKIDVEKLRKRLVDVACIEMEGAAVAQVCYEYGVPFGIVRTISDSANEHAPIHFSKFIQESASLYSFEIIQRFMSF